MTGGPRKKKIESRGSDNRTRGVSGNAGANRKACSRMHRSNAHDLPADVRRQKPRSLVFRFKPK